MEIIKRKILLETLISREPETWGLFKTNHIYLKVPIYQKFDNIGVFTDVDVIEYNGTTPNYQPVVTKLWNLGYSFPFMSNTSFITTNNNSLDEIKFRIPNKPISDYYNYQNLKINGITDSKKEELRTYKMDEEYIIGLNINKSIYTNYLNQTIIGVDRVTSKEPTFIYTFNANEDSLIGTQDQVSGILYEENEGETTFTFIGEGVNMVNSSLSGKTIKDYEIGFINQPQIKNDVFIDRGVVNVFDKHLRLSEINSLGALANYGNKLYNLKIQ